MVLSVIKLALKEDTSTDINQLLFSTGDNNNVTVTSGDKMNLSGLLICHSMLLNSPFEEPSQMDDLLDALLTERHPYTVYQSHGNCGEYKISGHHIWLPSNSPL
jgi:hypothetical protein